MPPSFRVVPRPSLLILTLVLAGGAAPLVPCAAQGVVSAPVVQVGRSETDPRDQLARVIDAASLVDGSMAVLDAGLPAIRLYSREGRWIRDLGRLGDGPGEFRSPNALTAVGNDVVVLDAAGRLLRYPGAAGAGETEAIRLPVLADTRYQLTVDQPGSGRVVVLRANERTYGRVRGEYRSSVGVLLWRAGGGIDSLAWFPSDSLKTDASGPPVPRPYAPALAVAIAADPAHVAVMAPESGQVRVFGMDGRAVATWRAEAVAQVPAAVDLARLRENRLRGLRGNDARVVGEWLDGQPGPPRPVVATRLLVAGDEVWLERPRHEGGRARWEVFGLRGERRFDVLMPTGFELLEVRQSNLLGVRRTDDDVEVLERRTLQRPTARQARPTPFADRSITTVNGLSFSPDGEELYVSRRVADTDARGQERVRLFRHTRMDGGWSAAEPLPWAAEHSDYQPVLSPDGGRLYFTSTRPVPGSTVEARQNVWVAERSAVGWGEPRVVPELVSAGWDGYAVPTRSGRLYFVSDRPGGRGAVDIWVADPAPDGGVAGVRNVAAVNSEHSDSDLYVDPAERFMVYHRWVEADRTADFWLARSSRGDWGRPRLLAAVNGPGLELSPTVTPDGQEFLYQREGAIVQVPFCALLHADELDLVTGQCGGEVAAETTRADTVDAATVAALDAANAAFSAAWVRGDGETLVAAYVPDAILHPPAGGVRVGTAAVRAIWGGASSGRLGHRLEPLLRRPLADGTVLEMGRWHSRRSTDTDPDPPWVWGCYTVIWRKDPGASWRMFYDAWSVPHTEEWACQPRP